MAERDTARESAIRGRGPAAGERTGPTGERHLRLVQRPTVGLPTPLTEFVGREREISEILRLLERARLVSLTGTGGSGKTRLALAVAERVGPDHPGGAVWVELAPLSDRELVPHAVAAAIGVRPAPGVDPVSALIDRLQGSAFLLVLDNCEHVVEACAHLARRLLGELPRLRILATSRESLRIGGEVAWQVPPLSLPSLAGDALAEPAGMGEAVQLFLDRARGVLPGFEVGPENGTHIARICTRLEGIPLAIELAAARIGVLTPAQIADRLDDCFALLTHGSRDAVPRQRTLRGAMDWSYDLLSMPEQRLFRTLSVFAGGFDLAAAEAVCGSPSSAEVPVLDTLTHLVEKSLVIVTEASGEARLRLLEPVRQYAATKLEEAGERGAVAARHAAWFLALAEEVEPALTGHDQASGMNRLEADHDNLRAALARFVAQGDALAATRLSSSLWRFWHTRGFLTEGRQWLRRALELGQGSAPEDTAPALRTARARSLQGAGVLAWGQGEYDVASAAFEEALALFRVLEDDDGVAALENNLGVISLHRAEYPRAAELFAASLAARRRQGNRQGIATLLNNLGATAGKQGELDRARAYYEESLALQREIGYTQGAAICLSNLGATAYDQGDLERARGYLEEGLTLRRLLGDRTGVADSLLKLGRVAHRAGDRDGARRHYGSGLALLRELGDKERIAGALLGIAALAVARGRAPDGARLLGAAEALRESIGAPLTAEERVEEERLEASAAEALEPVALRYLRAEGRALALEAALDLAETLVRPEREGPAEEGDLQGAAADVAGGVQTGTGAARGAAGPGGGASTAGPRTQGGSALPRVRDEPARPAALLVVRALGAVEILRGEHAVTTAEWGSARPRELLFHLLCHPEGRTKEQIGLALWPESSPAQLRNSFHVALHHLRRAVGDADRVVFEGDRYHFDRVRPYRFDVEEFEGLLDQADVLHRDGAGVAAVAQRIEEALSAYRGHFLEEIAGGRWVDGVRDRLRRRRQDALLALADLRLELDDPGAADSAYRTILSDDPLIERAHRGLMRAMARRGERERALAHFRILEALLRDELDAVPAPETRALVDQIRQGRAVS